ERHGAVTDKLPPSVWVRLNRQLAPFLVEKRIDDQPLLQFFHRQMADVARKHYDSAKIEFHVALASYFDCPAASTDSAPAKPGEPGNVVYTKRSLSELPYQLHCAANTSHLNEILTSPSWMQQKLAAFGPRFLINDYQYARAEAARLIGRSLELIA